MTALLHRDDAYLQSATVIVRDAGETGIVLDRTVFYAQGGGQPGDTGSLRHPDGRSVKVIDNLYAPDKTTVLHKIAPEDAGVFTPGERVTATIDWPQRLARMRIHTALHLLTTVLRFPVTGGAIGDGEGRLDFDMPDGVDRASVEVELNAVVARDLPVSARSITDEELLNNPGLVKTMSVKPPMGTGQVRLIAIGDVDLQPCGGTHVATTGEVGRVLITAIEKKGRQNRRVRVALAERNIG